MLLDYHLASLLMSTSEIILVLFWSRPEFARFVRFMVWKFEANLESTHGFMQNNNSGPHQSMAD